MMWFLPREAMRKRGLCCRPVSVRPSVCHVGVLYLHRWRYRQTSFSSGCPIILVFWTPAPIPNSKGNPFSGGAKYTGWVGKIAIFDLKSPFYFGNSNYYGTLIGSHRRVSRVQ